MKKIPVAPAAEKKKQAPSTFSKAMMAICGVLALILVLFTLIDLSGYHLIAAELVPIGCIFEAALLLIWLCGVIARRRKTEHGQRIFTLASSLVILLLGMLACTYIMQYVQIVMPHKYAVVESPEGQKVVILQAVDTGFAGNEATLEMLARMDERQAYIDEKKAAEAAEVGETASETGETAETAQTPAAEAAPRAEGVPSSVAVDENGEIAYDEDGFISYSMDAYDYEAYGYVFGAYPVRMGIFYDTNVECEGLIYRGSESASKIMHEWLSDGTLSIYLDSPEPGDSGKLSLHLVK